MRSFAAILLALVSSTVAAQSNPVAQPTRLSAEWQTRTRALFEQAIEIPTVAKHGEMPRMAQLIAGQPPE